MSNGEFDGVLEFGHCRRSVALQTQDCNTDHREEGAKRRVGRRARFGTRPKTAGFVPPEMSIEEHLIYNCRS